MTGIFVGLMSGTSLDAVDGALVDFREARPRTLRFVSRPIDRALRSELLALQSPGPDELHRAALAAIALTRAYADVVHALRADGAPAPEAIGAHGQTVRHRPESGYTLQLIDGALLAELTGVGVACDFRSADVAAGGQGAPLVPAFHHAVFAHPFRRRAIVNIGGMANVSLLSPGQAILGFDTGPGNVLLDHWCAAHTGAPFDRGGAWAASGRVLPGVLDAMLTEAYFDRPAPKSTGRELFDAGWLARRLDEAGAGGVSPSDIQATLAELTARTVARACTGFGAEEIFVCGGGSANADLMTRLGRACPGIRIETTAALGAEPQAVEAVAFAWLAERRVRLLPGNLPSVTGARGLRILGALHAAPTAPAVTDDQ